MFSVRINSYDGEALQSFIFRFAHANGISFLDICNSLRINDNENISKNDIHLIEQVPFSIIDIKQLSIYTKIEVKAILEMTFFYTLFRFNHSSKPGYNRCIKGLIRKKLYYCPYCLQENQYIPLIWKIDGIDYCTHHHIPLLNHCLTCGSNILLNNYHCLFTCSTCGSELKNQHIKVKPKCFDDKEQRWMLIAWKELISYTNTSITPSEIARKLLWVLKYDNGNLDETVLKKSMVIPLLELLQTARDSNAYTRSIHLKRLLSILHALELRPSFFLKISPPSNFLNHKKIYEQQAYFCQAPWCIYYLKKKPLIQKSTKYKKIKSGKIQRYYMVCEVCGCEYYIDEQNIQIEKTYFIHSYYALKYGYQLNTNSKRNQLSVSSLTRSRAYFASRDIGIDVLPEIDKDLIGRFLKALDEGFGIDGIMRWDCWDSYYHFLVYRYHQRVLQQRVNFKKRGKKKIDRRKLMNHIQLLCEKCIQEHKIITLGFISKEIGISENTLRKWEEAHQYIKELKKNQSEKCKQEKAKHLMQKVDRYFEKHKGHQIFSKDIYLYLNIKQSYITEHFPEVSNYVSEKRIDYYKLIKNEINPL